MSSAAQNVNFVYLYLRSIYPNKENLPHDKDDNEQHGQPQQHHTVPHQLYAQPCIVSLLPYWPGSLFSQVNPAHSASTLSNNQKVPLKQTRFSKEAAAYYRA